MSSVVLGIITLMCKIYTLYQFNEILLIFIFILPLYFTLYSWSSVRMWFILEIATPSFKIIILAKHNSAMANQIFLTKTGLHIYWVPSLQDILYIKRFLLRTA